MSDDPHHALHVAEVAAPVAVLYDLVADATMAPLVFPATVHVEHLERGDDEERIEIWAVDDARARRWVSQRRLDPVRRQVTFRQEAPTPPLAAMGGAWTFAEGLDRTTRVTLTHEFRAVDDDPEGLAWITAMVDTVSTGQMATLRAASALGPTGAAVRTFRRTATLPVPPPLAHAAARDARSWPVRGAILGAPRVTEVAPDVQLVDVAVAGPGTTSREARMALVGLAGHRVAVKEMPAPAGAAAHIATWGFADAPGGTFATVEDRVLADVSAATDVLQALVDGVGRTVLDAMEGARP